MFISRRKLMNIVDRLEDLETTRDDQRKVNSKHFDRIGKLEEAVFPATKEQTISFLDRYLYGHFMGNHIPKAKPTKISLLEEKLDAALKLLKVDVVRKGAEDPKYVATKNKRR